MTIRISQLSQRWDRTRSSFWFIPSVLVTGAILLAFVTLALDEAVSGRGYRGGWIYTGSAEGASILLGTIAGSMITLAGLVFSLTLVALTLASRQFGPRLLRNFMRDTVNQVVIGTFIATFLYSLLVLRAIRREGAGLFVPHLSVTLSVILALASLGILIYFIHHVSVSIQANEIVQRVASELMQGIDRLFPEHIGKGGPHRGDVSPDDFLTGEFVRNARPIGSVKDGYLQLIDASALMDLAVRDDVFLRVERRPGQYVEAGSPLVLAWPGDRVSEDSTGEINSAFILGSARTPLQDIEFSINQLVEIAVRALSPGVNDTFTPIVCIDRLGSSLCRLAQREMPSPYRRDVEGRVRIVAHAITFRDLVDSAFNQIRQSSRSNSAVSIRMLETITTIAWSVRRPEDLASLRRQADMIARGAREGLPEEEDRREVEARYREARRIFAELQGRVL